MLEARHVTAAGSAKASPFALPAQDFDGVVHEAVLHQAVKSFLGNQRQGTAATKTRSFVSGGNQKPWKQKGTGRARQGSTRAPHWRGGGTVFGPTPRSYRTELPRKVRQLARRSALNARAREGALVVIERLVFPAPKTSQMAALLDRLGLDGRKVLVLTHAHEPNVYLSGRNLPNVAIRPYREAAPYEVLWSDAVVVEEGALTGVEVVPTEMPAPPAPKVAKAPAEAKPAKGRVTKAAKAPAKKAAPKAEVKAPAKKTAAAKAKAKAPVKKAAGKKAAGGRAKTSPKKKGGK